VLALLPVKESLLFSARVCGQPSTAPGDCGMSLLSRLVPGCARPDSGDGNGDGKREHGTVTRAALMDSVPREARVGVAWDNVDLFVPVLLAPTQAAQSEDGGGGGGGGGNAAAGKDADGAKTATSGAALDAPSDAKGKGAVKQHGEGGQAYDLEAGTGKVPVGSMQTTGDRKSRLRAAALRQPQNERQVLFNVSGCAEPGELMALMGPSGCGKSSLLQVLGGRTTARPRGAIGYNGKKLTKAMKRSIGFVSQDDILYGSLTVFETLYYAAMLQLPRTMRTEDKIARAEIVMETLGLSGCRDTIIGDVFMRGVSGGERKRVSIGVELLTNPSVILLDEPTSGLDSTTALKLMHTLRNLASGGRSILTSIHQPSSRLFQQTDKLLLLAGGRTVYYGNALACPYWFEQCGQPVPFGVSTADHILDVACGDLPGHTPEDSVRILDGMVQTFAHRTVGRGRNGVQASDLGASAVAGAESALRERIALNMSLSRDPSTIAAAKSVLSGASPQRHASGGGADAHVHVGSAASAGGLGPAVGGGSAATLDARLDPLAEHAVTLPGSNSSSGADMMTRFPASRDPLTDGTASTEDGAERSALAVDATAAGDDDDDDERRRQMVGDADEPAADGDAAPGGSKWGAKWTDQVYYLTTRSLKTRRFSSLSWQRFAETIIIALLAGCFWWQIGAGQLTPQSAQDIGGVLFFVQLFLSFSAMFQAIFNYPSEFSMVVKERQSGMYRLSAYYVARSLSDLPMDCLLPSILIIIVYWMAGLRITPGAFFGHWWATLLLVLIAQVRHDAGVLGCVVCVCVCVCVCVWGGRLRR